MHLLLTLLLAHLLADFPLQWNGLAKLKQNSIQGVVLHVLIYVAATALLLNDPLQYWPLIGALGGAHFCIDVAKTRCRNTRPILCFIIDQIVHLATLVLASLVAGRIWPQAPQGVLSNDLLWVALICATLLAAMVFCWIWTTTLTEEQLERHFVLKWTKQQMLNLEQRAGLLLMGFIVIAQFLL